MKKITVAIAGLGSRGMHAYGQHLLDKGSAIVTAIAEPQTDRMEKAKKAFGLPCSACFTTLEELVKGSKLADVMIIATQDGYHHSHAIKSLEAGYDILIEKPIATTLEDCEDIAATAKRLNRKVAVCHILRYAPFYQAVRKTIADGIIGEPVNITALENVGYFHQAHSYVRGNWNNSQKSSFMLLAKCCHDLDLLVWLMGKPAKKVSSFGSLKLFTAENMPEGSSPRCMEGCSEQKTCPFDCERYYIESNQGVKNNKGWPVNILTENITEDSIRQVLKTGPYGRCVFACDNDVVDHQIVNISFADGGTASLTMCGLTSRCHRELRLMGTKGEIFGDLDDNRLTIAVFGKEPQVMDLTVEESAFAGHGGGDGRLLDDFIKFVAGEQYDTLSMTNIDVSLQSHQIAFAAEKSRLTGDTVVI